MQSKKSSREVLITGGAGFIGSNLAARLLATTQANVRILDNLSRPNVDVNLSWLENLPGARKRLRTIRGDVRNYNHVLQAADGCTEIYHLAAQVAVTTSVVNPVEDFAINAAGTLNVLEAARSQRESPFVLFTSTNKVYGSLESLRVRQMGARYVAENSNFSGIDEETPLDFHSPYGCSKGAADQYVRDYARIYGIPTVVFRMSCICGPRQFGTEDQGWVAHFLYSVLHQNPVTVYGNGCQVRDVLHVDDLLDGMEAVRACGPKCQGQVFNVGGGHSQSVSLNEMLAAIEKMLGKRSDVAHGDVRAGDQPLYISNTAKLNRFAGWHPRRPLLRILQDIHAFGAAHPQIFEQGNKALVSEAAEGMVA